MMSGRKRKSTSKFITVEVNSPTPLRFRWLDYDCRKLEIDLRGIFKPKRNNPVHRKALRRFKSPEHLQALCDEYFASCDGVLYNHKTGKPYLDSKGVPVTGNIRPYTLTGLALYLDMSNDQFRRYEKGRLDDIGYDVDSIAQYSWVVRKARQKVEAYAESRLYDRNGSFGAKFVLDCAFNWVTQRDRCEIDTQIATRELKKKEFELKERLLDSGDDEEREITINIKRAGGGKSE